MRYASYIVLLALIPGWVGAQEDDHDNLNQEVITVGSRQLELRDVYKPAFTPQEMDTVVEKTDVVYSVEPVFHETEFIPDTIAPARLKIVEPLNRLYRFHAKAGVGIYTTTLADIYYNSLRSRKGQLGLRLNHRASAGGIDDIASEGSYSTNRAGIWGEAFVKKLTLGGELDYRRQVRHFYGYRNNFVDIVRDPFVAEIEHHFEMLEGRIYAHNRTHKQRKLDFFLDGRYRISRDWVDATENQAIINGQFNRIMDSETYGLGVRVDYNTLDGVLETPDLDSLPAKQQSTLVTLNPSVRTYTGKWDVKVGLKIIPELMPEANHFHFFPDIRASLKVYEEFFVPYLVLTGDVDRVNFRSLLLENPFIISKPELRNEKTNIEGSVGMRGVLSSKMAYNLQFNYMQYGRKALFVKDGRTRYPNRFLVVYDELQVIGGKAQLSHHINDRFNGILTVAYRQYTPKRQLGAWYMSDITGTATLEFNLRNKLIIRSDVVYRSERQAFIQIADPSNPDEMGRSADQGTMETLAGYADLNLGFEYRYTRRISAFLNFTNLLANQYEWYQDYPVQGFGALGGFSYSF